MRLETKSIQTADGLELYVRSYRPEQSDPARTLYWVHGVGEHGGRHEHMAEALTQRGWTMIVSDLRGHGQSTGALTHISSFDRYVDDIVLVWEQLGLTHAAPVLFGHSMGGLVAVRAVQQKRVAPSALVLSSPLLGLKLRVNPFTLFLGRLLVRFRPTTRFSNGIDPANMTRNGDFATLRRRDKLINKTVTAGWFFAMQAALTAARRDAPLVTLPVYALQGSLDRTTDPAALADWWKQIVATDKELLILDNHVHELFFESDWRETALRMLDWLEQRVARK
jgi:lysophospholipase